MVPDQVGSALAHKVRVEIMPDLPDQTPIMRRGCAAGKQAKEIAPLMCGKTGVPVVIDPNRFHDRDGQGFEVVVQRLGQTERVPIGVHVAMGDLSQRVNPCVSASSRANCVGAGFKLGQGIFDRALNRWLVGLSLPSGKGGSVVFDFEGIARHGHLLARDYGAGNP